LAIGVLESAVPSQYVSDLSKEETKVGRLNPDIFEAQERAAALLVAPEHLGVQFEPRKRYATLYPAMELEELDVHVDSIGKFRMELTDGTELDDLPRFRARRAWGLGGIPHVAIIHNMGRMTSGGASGAKNRCAF